MVSDAVFIAYLGKTLGETVGLAAIVVRYLFPPPTTTPATEDNEL